MLKDCLLEFKPIVLSKSVVYIRINYIVGRHQVYSKEEGGK